MQKRGARGEHPTHVIAASLATFGFRSRLVYKGYVSSALDPRRGITAGSPFATGHLWLVRTHFARKIFEEPPEVVFGAHVDDMSCSRESEKLMSWSRAMNESKQE